MDGLSRIPSSSELDTIEHVDMGKKIWELYLVGMLFHSFAFWQIIVEKYRAKFKWILQALLGIQRWNLMTLDLLIFFGNPQVLT